MNGLIQVHFFSFLFFFVLTEIHCSSDDELCNGIKSLNIFQAYAVELRCIQIVAKMTKNLTLITENNMDSP